LQLKKKRQREQIVKRPTVEATLFTALVRVTKVTGIVNPFTRR